MPNKNYLSGRRLEYEIIKMAKAHHGQATRTAGSHGWIDVVSRFIISSKAAPPPLGVLYPEFKWHHAKNDVQVMKRVGPTYTDTLYIEVMVGAGGSITYTDQYLYTVCHLIQCKRVRNRGQKK